MKIFRLDKYENESRLIKDCLADNPKAQKYLFEKYSPKFLAISNRYINDYKIAEDVLMESFYKIFKKLETFKHNGSLEGWMKKLLINECLNHLRKNKNIFISIEDKKIDIPDIELDERSKNERALILINILKQLPEGYRSVFNLYVLEGYKHKEISELLNISESTSKTQLFKAKKLIKRTLESSNKENYSYESEDEIINYLNISHG